MADTRDFQGKWALVTGASAGIGAALARQLAAYGAKLVLTARREDRLEALASELRAKGTEVRIILADLTDPAAPQAIFDVTQRDGVMVEILINNAGLGQYGDFYKTDMNQEFNQIRVNCEATVRLTRLFLPSMVERRRGWVMVLASTASFQPVPFLSTYAATKAFDRYFALGLAEEVAPYGVKVSALCPGPTESEFFDIAKAAQFKDRKIQSAEEVARLGLEALAGGRRAIIPYFAGRATAFAVRLLPVGLITYFVAKVARPK
jgi:short-subunit dehydrogenase